MGYNRDNFKRIRAEYETKTFRAQEEADIRRSELYLQIPALRALDSRLSGFALQIMQASLRGENTEEAIAALREENDKIRAERAALLLQNGYPFDYTEPRYECEACRDTGYVGIKMCACMKRKLIEAGMESSGLSALMKKQSFDNFSLDFYKANPREHKIMQSTYAAVRAYAEKFTIEAGKPMPQSLLFYGGTGLGKTHLSTALAKRVIERGFDVSYTSAINLFGSFETARFGSSTAGEGGSDPARYRECDLLIIDDLGTEFTNQFTVSCLYMVINHRLNAGLPTVVSTNLSPKEIKERYVERVSSRLLGEFKPILFVGTDVRRQKLTRT